METYTLKAAYIPDVINEVRVSFDPSDLRQGRIRLEPQSPGALCTFVCING